MGGLGGGAASPVATEKEKQASKSCQECTIYFSPNPNDPGQLFWSKACFHKQHSQKIKNAVPSKQAKRKPKQAQRPATLPFPPPATNGTKRNQDSRIPGTPSNIEQTPSLKKGKLEHITNFLADQPLDNLDSLGNDELACKLKTCISYLISDLEATVKLQHSFICQFIRMWCWS